MKPSKLLTLDACINLALGVLLLVFPATLVDLLGIPSTEQAFYPNILGAVLFGIGIALWLGRTGNPTGLGLGGAISINLCGGLVLAAWLIFGRLEIPVHGQVTLWLLVLLLVGLSAVEVVAQVRRPRPT